MADVPLSLVKDIIGVYNQIQEAREIAQSNREKIKNISVLVAKNHQVIQRLKQLAEDADSQLTDGAAVGNEVVTLPVDFDDFQFFQNILEKVDNFINSYGSLGGWGKFWRSKEIQSNYQELLGLLQAGQLQLLIQNLPKIIQKLQKENLPGEGRLFSLIYHNFKQFIQKIIRKLREEKAFTKPHAIPAFNLNFMHRPQPQSSEPKFNNKRHVPEFDSMFEDTQHFSKHHETIEPDFSKQYETMDLDVNFKKELQAKLGRVLGSGGFVKVYEAEWKGQKVAVKVINEGVFNEGSDAYEALKSEVETSCKISGQCDRVVRILGASLKDSENMCIIMELVEGGSLADRIYNKSIRKLSYLEILLIAYDISCALAYLHPTIIHRDLKPQNILMDDKGRAKIADFGISRFKDPDATHPSGTQPNGTPSYMAPDMFNGIKVDEKCDVYSVGVILWECLTRCKPWNEHSRFAQIIMSVAIMGERLKVPETAPPVLKRLIERCWDADPQRRPSAQEIMRNTEVYIQQELHSIQNKKNPLEQRITHNSSSSSASAMDRNLVHNGDRQFKGGLNALYNNKQFFRNNAKLKSHPKRFSIVCLQFFKCKFLIFILYLKIVLK